MVAYVVQGGDCEGDNVMIVSEAAVRLRGGVDFSLASEALEDLDVSETSLVNILVPEVSVEVVVALLGTSLRMMPFCISF